VVASPAPRLLKDFFSCAYILLKVEAHSWPGKIIKAEIRDPVPAGLHFPEFLDCFNLNYPFPGVNRNFFPYILNVLEQQYLHQVSDA
jgi:hypothetical protein